MHSSLDSSAIKPQTLFMKKHSTVHLPATLKSLVHHSVALFGEILKHEVGIAFFNRIESLREKMSGLRGQTSAASYRVLQKDLLQLQKLSPEKRLALARSFTLMLELMNACENAYRTSRSWNVTTSSSELPQQITYVLTAHPTEARSPENIDVFHQIQALLIQVLKGTPEKSLPVWSPQKETDLKHLLEIAWRTWIVRNRSPKVRDEADHIYSTLFRRDVFQELLDLVAEGVPLRLYTWVGGDKDGHPGVQERTLLESLTLSRAHLVDNSLKQLHSVRTTLTLFQKRSSLGPRSWQKKISILEKEFRRLRKVQPGDGGRVQTLKTRVNEFIHTYTVHIGEKHPALRCLEEMILLFPGMVVPLELRESSDVLMTNSKKPLAIDRMLKRLARLSRGGDPRWYAHGFIISMAESIEHIRRAAAKQREVFGYLPLPIIPLFEEAKSLKRSPEILKEFVGDRSLKAAAKKYWNGQLELMVGYSDSSKEAGVLFSRLAIAQALPALEKICLRAGLTPVFFHGSGGSVDRGGGSIQDQTAWWPHSALRNYKVTIQGEMVERSLATPEIARGQIQHILKSVEDGVKRKPITAQSPSLETFAERVQTLYSEMIQSESFLKIVEKATPYSYLRLLKLGSRPSKRAQQLQVSGLRAIPWILCWTQTRVLFPTWWGVGTAWKEASPKARKELQKAFRTRPAFTSYVKALGFTLAKTELGIWHLYLQNSTLTKEEASAAYEMFEVEWLKTCRFFKEVSGQKNFTWEKPWLAESIWLRSPMIHPLNLLQILAQKDHDIELLRVTATGISSGMMTTG
jgi:phosphoenolpyruvate carboxylase